MFVRELYSYLCSPRRRYVLQVHCRFRLPAFRTCHVPPARLWAGMHTAGCDSDRSGLPYVSTKYLG